MIAVFTATLILILSTCGCQAKSVTVVVAGSTSVQPYVEVLTEVYEHIYPERKVDVQGGGSSAGITAAQTETADIGMSSRALKGSELELWSIEIAKDGLAIIVNPKCPIQDLRMEQIRCIFNGSITNWNELGGQNAKIHLIAREEGSGTRSAFEDLVMGGERLTPKAIIQDSNGAVRQLVSNDPNAIGYISLGLVNHTVKAIRFDKVTATIENVINGSYNLTRPFLFVTSSQPKGEVKLFIDFTISAEGQRQLMNEGLIPVIEASKLKGLKDEDF